MGQAHASPIASDTPDLLPNVLDNYANIPLPDHFLTAELQALDNTPANNQTTNEGATLGRVLFYDKKLSANDTISCGSCHLQKHSFGDAGLGLGIGINGQNTDTKTLPLANLRWRSSFGSGAFTLEEATLEAQSLLAFTNSREMGNSNISDVIFKITSLPYYHNLFTQAFGDQQVTANRIARALSQFMRSMVSFNSKFDNGVASNFSNFSDEEELGRTLFNSDQTKCSECHATTLQLMLDTPGGNGINTASHGVAALRNASSRNSLTLHGGFTLESIMNHYNRQLPTCNTNQPTVLFCDEIVNSSNNALNNNGQVLEMNLSSDEEQAIIAFLKTLSDPMYEISIDEEQNTVRNDYSLLFEEKYANPFFIKTDIPRIGDINGLIPSFLLLLEE